MKNQSMAKINAFPIAFWIGADTLHFSLICTAKQHKLDPYQYYVEIMKAISHQDAL